ncbi:MAG: pyruvate ferredoxin oxidoreductase [Epsilonproteobacteria bacterium]|nr:pyruvate ferredoxin oxidoreductase [Campylobacterota bacterium]
MKSIRIHGRGGQGAVLASKILAYAYFLEGKFSQSFPTYGAERRGAPVASFVKVDDSFINERCPVKTADMVLVLSDSIIKLVDIVEGTGLKSIILINSNKKNDTFSLETDAKILTFDISKIAVDNGLGTPSFPLVNIPALGIAGKIDGIKLDSLIKATEKFVPYNVEDSIRALKAAYRSTINE